MYVFPVSSAIQKLRNGTIMHCVLSRSYAVFVFLFKGSHYLRKKFFFVFSYSLVFSFQTCY